MKSSQIPVSIDHLLTSPEHIYRGHYGGPSGNCPCEEHNTLHLTAGKGIVGDRYLDYEKTDIGQITFFDLEVLDALSRRRQDRVDAKSVRRNVFLRGVDLNTLIGRTFSLQGIRFEGTEECRPCFWMDEAVEPGTEAFMRGHGGLRARILNDGSLTLGSATLEVEEKA